MTATVLALAILQPIVAGAQVHVGFSLSGSVQSYGMGGVHAYLDDWGFENAPPGISDGQVEEKDMNPGVTGAVRVTRNRVALGLEYTALTGWLKIRKTSVFGGPPWSSKVDVAARAYSASVAYLPLSWGSFHLGAGLGAGYYVANASQDGLFSSGQSDSKDWKGHGTGIHFLAIGEREWSSGWGVQIAMGYRKAKTTTLEANGQPVTTSHGDEVQLDWSGAVFSLGLFAVLGR